MDELTNKMDSNSTTELLHENKLCIERILNEEKLLLFNNVKSLLKQVIFPTNDNLKFSSL